MIEIVQFLRYQISQIIYDPNKKINSDVAFLNPYHLEQEEVIFEIMSQTLLRLNSKYLKILAHSKKKKNF